MKRRELLKGMGWGAFGAAAAVGAGAAAAAEAEAEVSDVKKRVRGRIIDTRCRPMFGDFAKQFTPQSSEMFYRKAGLAMPESVKASSEEKMLAEMDEAGIAVGIAPSRFIPNEHLVQMVEHFKGRFVGMAAIDQAEDVQKNIEIVDKYVLNGPLKGIHFEPGHFPVPLKANDPKFYPLYEYCEEKGVVVGLMLGGNNAPNFVDHTDPRIITQLAADFPKLQWFICHGGWPWVQQILGACYWRDNIWLEPDMYSYNGMPGCMDYVNAANGFLQDRFMYGSSYPLLPMKETVEMAERMFSDEVYEKVMYKNAAKLFKLDAA